MSLRLIGDVIELDGRPIATVVPGLRLAQRDRLTELFDALDEDYVASLEDHIERMSERLKEGKPA